MINVHVAKYIIELKNNIDHNKVQKDLDLVFRYSDYDNEITLCEVELNYSRDADNEIILCDDILDQFKYIKNLNDKDRPKFPYNFKSLHQFMEKEGEETRRIYESFGENEKSDVYKECTKNEIQKMWQDQAKIYYSMHTFRLTKIQKEMLELITSHRLIKDNIKSCYFYDICTCK